MNLDADNTVPLRDYLGEFAHGPRGLPVRRDDAGLQVPRRRRQQLEAVHRRVRRVLPRTGSAREAVRRRRVRASSSATASRRLHYELDGPHGMVSSWGGMAPPKDLEHGQADRAGPAQRPVRPVGPARHPGLDELPPGLNPARTPAWGVDSFVFFPNFMLLVWAPGWYLTYHYWPTSYNRHIFEGTLYFVPPKNGTRAPAPGAGRGHVQGVRLQDGNTLEATQTMLESRAVTEFPLERPGDPAPPPPQDRAASTWRPAATGRRRRPSASSARRRSDADDNLPRRVRRPRAVRRLGARAPSASATPSGWPARWTSCRRSTTPRSPGSRTPRPTSSSSRSTPCPTTPATSCCSATRSINVSFPVEVWRQPRVPDSGASTLDVVVEPAV